MMANNRLFLTNLKTGDQVCLGRYWPQTDDQLLYGWHCRDTNLEEFVNRFFRDNQVSIKSMWGIQPDWVLTYEVEEE
jgi:hypothetical protein